jgi:hypothetical protein
MSLKQRGKRAYTQSEEANSQLKIHSIQSRYSASQKLAGQ